MFERVKLVTSSVRAAAMVAGAVILTPCAFADSVPILPDPTPIVLTPGAPLNLTEGPAITPFTVMVTNTTANLITLDGLAINVPNTDLSDKLFVTRVGDNCPIAGLTAAGLVLSDGSDTYRVPPNASNFTLPTAIAYGSGYTVSVRTQPAGLTCTVSGGSGTVPASAVMNVEVTCASSSYTLGGSISGLTTSGLVLTDGVESLSVSANAAQFSMPHALASGSSYAVAIQAQPSRGGCQIAHDTGTVSGDVDSVQVTCGAAAAP